MRRLQKNTRILTAPLIILPLLFSIGIGITVGEIKKHITFTDTIALASTFFTMKNASSNLMTVLYNGESIDDTEEIVSNDSESEVDSTLQNQPVVNIQEEVPENTENVIQETEPSTENNIIKDTPTAPAEPGKGIVLTEQYIKGSTLSAIPYGDGFIKNVTGLSASDVIAYASEEPEFNILKNGLPQVLIYHTHTTETYLDEDNGQYDLSYSGRTDDPEKNMVRIGEEIVKQLEEIGIGVIHDKTIHDYSYNGSYGRSADTVVNALNQYPSIEIALDIHRDAIVRDDGVIIKPTSNINGKNAAQVMIISGCDNGSMNMSNWPHNLRFAVRLQNKMESMFPGLTRPILFDYRSYNQRLTNGSLLIEVGSHANTLDEAVYAGELVGKSLAAYLEEIAK